MMAPAESFSLETLADRTVRVRGQLDSVSASVLGERLAEEDCPLRLDLSGVTFMDAAAVHVLLEHRERCTERAEDFQLVAVSDAVRQVIELSGMAAMFAAGRS